MQFEVVFLLLFGFVSFSNGAPREGLPLLNPGGIGGVFEGPNSETIIIGPDGSEITSEQKGGAVIRDDGLLSNNPIVVAESELSEAVPIFAEESLSAGPIISSTEVAILAPAAPVIASAAPLSTPLLTGETYAAPAPNLNIEVPLITPEVSLYETKPIEIIQQDPHIIETEIIEAPDIESNQNSDLKGPSGRIVTKGSASVVSGPASTTITEPLKIIVAPPKIAIGTPVIATATIPLEASLNSLPAVSYEASSTLAPPPLSYSTSVAPVEYGYSTTTTPLVEGPYSDDVESTRIDLGANDFRHSIPVVEYSSSNGVLNEHGILENGAYSSTEAPTLSSSLSTGLAGEFSSLEGQSAPSAYLTPPEAPQSFASGPRAPGLVPATGSPYIQKIPRIGDNIAVDDRVDMEFPAYRKLTPKTYKLPQVLGMALSDFYQKFPAKPKDTIIIDDKMGELAQNEITSYDTRDQFLSAPDLSQSRYLAPALARNGIDASQVNLATVPLSEVTRISDGTYQRGIDSAYLGNRYEREAKRKRSN